MTLTRTLEGAIKKAKTAQMECDKAYGMLLMTGKGAEKYITAHAKKEAYRIEFADLRKAASALALLEQEFPK